MPKSKTRKTTSRPRRPEAPLSPERELEGKTLAVVEASLEVVRDAEQAIARAAWKGDGPTSPEVAEALEVHHLLRTGALAMLKAYSRLAGLPDPADSPAVTGIR